MILELVPVIVAIWVYLDILYPYVVYPLMARGYKAGAAPIVRSWPFGIPVTVKLIKAVRQGRLLDMVYNDQIRMPFKTALRQSTFKWVFFTRDPENVKAILSTKFSDYGLTERIGDLAPIFGSGIFMQDGEDWKHSRAMLRPQFSRDQVSRLEHISQHVNDMIDVIDQSAGTVNLLHIFHLLTMDTATEFLFGKSVNSLHFSSTHRGSPIETEDGRIIYSADFVESYTWLNDYALNKILLNAGKWILKFTKPELNFHLERARSFIDHYVHKALEHTAASVPENEADEKNPNYVFSYELAKETRDPIILRDQLFNILIAGRDTTAAAFSFCFYYFALYPDTWRRCREEILDAFGSGEMEPVITYDKLKALKYLHFFIKEVLRLHPVVPLNTRTAIKNTLLPRGGGKDGSKPLFVPKGTPVNYSVYVMHRDKSIYGPDAEEFRPERWDPANKIDNSPMYTWGYLPFNGGPRICLGQQFALTELTLAIAKLAMEFRYVEKAEGFPTSLKERNSLTLLIAGNDVPVRFVR